MDTIGVDLHKRESQLCTGQDDGIVVEMRIVTECELLLWNLRSSEADAHNDRCDAKGAAGRTIELVDAKCRGDVVHTNAPLAGDRQSVLARRFTARCARVAPRPAAEIAANVRCNDSSAHRNGAG